MKLLFPGWLIYTVAGLLGLIVGSFLNVCIYRMPRDQSLLGRSCCPSCGEMIAWYDNIPLLSFFLLSGNCRHCGQRISARYPGVELCTGLLFLGVAIWWLHTTNLHFVNIVLVITFLTVSFGMTLVDLKFSIIPNEMNYFLLIVGLLVSGIPRYPFRTTFQYRWDFAVMGESLLGMALGGSIFFLLAYISPYLYGRAALGMGDVKLIAAYGLWLGPKLIFFTIVSGALIGALAGTTLMIFRGKSLRTEIPFGPYLCLAGSVALLWGHEIVDWYLNLTQVNL